MRKVNIALLGATGAVGREMLAVLEERNFPINNLILLSSARSTGKEMAAFGTKHAVCDAAKYNFSDVDIVLGAVSAELSRVYTPRATAQGAVVIDNSSAYRLDDDVPLVIPEINPEDVRRNRGIIANPNCTTTITLVAVQRINSHCRIERLNATTYQAVSGAGIEAVQELQQQTADYAANRPLSTKVLRHQILFNLIPQIDDFCDNGYTREEMKMVHESRKILHDPEIRISCTCVRVPVLRSHSVAVTLECEDELTPQKVRDLLRDAPGVALYDDVASGIYPMPLAAAGQDLVHVGRIRHDLSGGGICLWCCGDQLRKGAATNAVQIAELLLQQHRTGGYPEC